MQILTTGLTPAGGADAVVREEEEAAGPATEVQEEEEVVEERGVRVGGEEQEVGGKEAVVVVLMVFVREEAAAGGLVIVASVPAPAVMKEETMDVTEVGVDELLLQPELLLLHPLELGSLFPPIPDRDEQLPPLLMLTLFASRVFKRFASAVFVFGVTCVLLP